MNWSVRVKTNASKNLVEVIEEGKLRVWIKEKPIQGKANEAVLKILAEHFGVKPSVVVLIKGHKSKEKIIRVGARE
jgi:hypothetical protein